MTQMNKLQECSYQKPKSFLGNDSLPFNCRNVPLSFNSQHILPFCYPPPPPPSVSDFPLLTGIDFKVKTIEVEGKKVKLQVW